MKISMDKRYRTINDLPVRILSTSLKSKKHPVAAIIIEKDGTEHFVQATSSGVNDLFNIVEIHDWEFFELDQQVIAQIPGALTWHPAHFATVKRNGNKLIPYVWVAGTNSWTTNGDMLPVLDCRKPNEFELNSYKNYKDRL